METTERYFMLLLAERLEEHGEMLKGAYACADEDGNPQYCAVGHAINLIGEIRGRHPWVEHTQQGELPERPNREMVDDPLFRMVRRKFITQIHPSHHYGKDKFTLVEMNDELHMKGHEMAQRIRDFIYNNEDYGEIYHEDN